MEMVYDLAAQLEKKYHPEHRPDPVRCFIDPKQAGCAKNKGPKK
jgi:hypothetical protein